MIRRKIMIIGAEGSGKRMLADCFNATEMKTPKTADIIFGKQTIVIPGGFLENPWMYKHIITVAQNYASHLLVTVDGETNSDIGSPGFTQAFVCPIFGVITGKERKSYKREKALFFIKKLGIQPPFFFVNRENSDGFKELKNALSYADSAEERCNTK